MTIPYEIEDDDDDDGFIVSEMEPLGQISEDELHILAENLIRFAFSDMRAALRFARSIHGAGHSRSRRISLTKDELRKTLEDINFFRSARFQMWAACLDLPQEEIDSIKARYLSEAKICVQNLRHRIEKLGG